MKKLLFLLALCILCSTVNMNKADAFAESTEFLTNLETCSPYTPKNLSFDGQIIGKKNGKCHVSYQNGNIKNTKTNKEINFKNCYFPTSELRKYVYDSKEMSKMFDKFLSNPYAMNASTQAKLEKTAENNFNFMAKYCK